MGSVLEGKIFSNIQMGFETMLRRQRELCINRALESLLCSLVLKGFIPVLCLKERLQASLITCKIPGVTFIVIITVLPYLSR